jgi:hypothetical protein
MNRSWVEHGIGCAGQYLKECRDAEVISIPETVKRRRFVNAPVRIGGLMTILRQ